jgi:hypothetical protein
MRFDLQSSFASRKPQACSESFGIPQFLHIFVATALLRPLLHHPHLRNMEKIFYNSISQRESYDRSSIEGPEDVCQPEHQPSSTIQQRIILRTLCIILPASFTTNTLFLYQQYGRQVAFQIRGVHF